jgi:hypothetical protein
VLFEGGLDERAHVGGGVGVVDPRQPLAQIGAIPVRRGENLLSVFELELPELEPRRYHAMKHQASATA